MFKKLMSALGALAIYVSGFAAPGAMAQIPPVRPQVLAPPTAVGVGVATPPCQCSASLMNTPARVHFAQFPPTTDWAGTVSGAVEMPSVTNTLPWNVPQRFDIDIQASKLRMVFARDATYGPGAQFTFSLNPVAPAPCGPARVVASQVTTNRTDAAAYVVSQSQFNSANNTVTLVFNNQGTQPFADWRANDWIEAQLSFDCATTVQNQAITPVVTGPIDACLPYKLCFDLKFLMFSPQPPLNGTLSLQLTQNGVPVGVPLTQPFAQAGQYCFSMPALPPGSGYDYVVTETHTTVGPTISTSTLQSPVPGQNNDLVCNGQAASSCCPPVNHDLVVGMFRHDGNSASTYTQSLDIAATATTTFVNGLNAYLTYLKFLCPQIATLRVDFFTGPVAPPSVPNGPAGPLIGADLTTPKSTVPWNTAMTVPGLNGALGAMNSYAHNNGQYYRIAIKVTGVNAAGQPVKCGFEESCSSDDTFGFIYNTTAKMAPGWLPITR